MDDESTSGTRRVLRAELIIATLALLTSACASVAALYQTFESARQTEATIAQTKTAAAQLGASVWPYLTIETSFAPTAFEFEVTNEGLGPALIRSFTFTVDGKTTSSTGAAFGFIDPNRDRRRRVSTHDFGAGSVIRPSQTVTVFSLSDPAFDRARAQRVVGRLRADICYCSLLKECWTLDSADTEPKSVEKCGAPRRVTTF